MNSLFEIFGLERVPPPVTDDPTTGQPYLFRKYPQQFESFDLARGELKKIMRGDSIFQQYEFNHYVVLEVYTKSH
jgi:hypothetical protein